VLENTRRARGREALRNELRPTANSSPSRGARPQGLAAASTFRSVTMLDPPTCLNSVLDMTGRSAEDVEQSLREQRKADAICLWAPRGRARRDGPHGRRERIVSWNAEAERPWLHARRAEGSQSIDRLLPERSRSVLRSEPHGFRRPAYGIHTGPPRVPHRDTMSRARAGRHADLKRPSLTSRSREVSRVRSSNANRIKRRFLANSPTKLRHNRSTR